MLPLRPLLPRSPCRRRPGPAGATAGPEPAVAGPGGRWAAAGCGSSTNSGSSTTLTLFGADYGTGPANSTTKYWDGIASAFHKANPNITVNVQTVNWTDFPNKVQTLVQNKQFPDLLEGSTAPQFAQSHLLYKSSQVLAPAVLNDIMPKFLKDTA